MKYDKSWGFGTWLLLIILSAGSVFLFSLIWEAVTGTSLRDSLAYSGWVPGLSSSSGVSYDGESYTTDAGGEWTPPTPPGG